MGDVVKFRGVTSLDIPADDILEAAIGKLEHVFIMGFDLNGDVYFASSSADGGDALWLMEVAKFKLLSGEYERE